MTTILIIGYLVCALLGLDPSNAMACWESPPAWAETERWRFACRIDMTDETVPHLAIVFGETFYGAFSVDLFIETALDY